MKRYQFFADEEQLKLLRRYQVLHGVPVAEQIRRAIDEYLLARVAHDAAVRAAGGRVSGHQGVSERASPEASKESPLS